MSENWSDEELEAAAVSYIEMKELQDSGQVFKKKTYYESLHERFGRTVKSYEYRMQNISYVYQLLGRSYVNGLRPAKNVGSNVIKVIEKVIEEKEGGGSHAAYQQSLISASRKKRKKEKPAGSKAPNKQTAQSTSYVRDPDVVSWVLENSNGICECCMKKAPFEKHDGTPYLEVHHVKRLADRGSDTVTNAVAVCPNCHMELHYGLSRDALKVALYDRNSRLIPE